MKASWINQSLIGVWSRPIREQLNALCLNIGLPLRFIYVSCEEVVTLVRSSHSWRRVSRTSGGVLSSRPQPENTCTNRILILVMSITYTPVYVTVMCIYLVSKLILGTELIQITCSESTKGRTRGWIRMCAYCRLFAAETCYGNLILSSGRENGHYKCARTHLYQYGRSNDRRLGINKTSG